MENKKQKFDFYIKIGLILIIGLISRIIIHNVLNLDADFRGGDSGYYLEVARNILNNSVHGLGSPPEPTFFRAPLYSLFVAGIIYFFGENVFAFFIAQSVLTIILGLLIFLMLSTARPILAFYAALLIVASPSDVFFNARVLGETLTTFFLVLGITQVYIAKSRIQFFIAGLLFALTSLVRDVYIFLPLFVVVYFLFFRRIHTNLIVFLLVGFILGVAPWVGRNAMQQGGGLFISKGASGYNLWVGTWERNPQWTIDLKFPDYAFSSEEEKKTIKYAAADNNDKYMQNLAFARITGDFISVATIWVKRAPRLWIGTRSDLVTFVYERYGAQWYFIKYALFMFNVIILATAALGIALSIKRREGLVIFTVPCLYTALIYFPFHNTETRYSQPIYSILLIFSVYLVVELFPHIKKLYK